MFLAVIPSSPVVTFTYLQRRDVEPHGICAPSRRLICRSFGSFPSFDFSIWRESIPTSERPKELFNSAGDHSARIGRHRQICLRYFQIRKAWDLNHYTSVTEADLIFRNQAKTRFAGQRFEHLYRGWKDRASEPNPTSSQEFRTERSPRRPCILTLKCFARMFAFLEQEPEEKG